MVWYLHPCKQPSHVYTFTGFNLKRSQQLKHCIGLQVDILDLEPRPNPGNDNRTYGSNAAASWGYQFRAGFLDGLKREIVTIYELIQAANGKSYVAIPDYQFK